RRARRGSVTGRLARACAGLLLALAAGLAPARAPAERLVVATTTSVRDSGLMDALLPLFESESGYDVELIAVGSGAALRMAATGEADVVVSHAPEEEQRLVAEGALEDRRPFMYGYFVVAGPAADPARVAEAASASDAVRRIAAAEAPYVSRGDESGTHLREQGLFRAAGLAHAARWTGFASTGSGMGPTLLVAGERRAYALADRATFEAFRARTDLAALFEEREPALRNDYAVLRPAARGRAPRVVDVAGARRFADFLLAPATQARIGQFGRDADGAPLFHPGVGER
ncbi:MAG TPA: substrate-binding domain-containing protein, partial [Myxococcota bacterium]|nr:substrate-binding domain-containing protein [Myxococcota bacterium]